MARSEMTSSETTSTTTALYIGLDLSTQQLKLTLINHHLAILHEEAVNFDRDLPHYGTKGGTIRNGLEATAPTLMWIEAVDILFRRLQEKRIDFGNVQGLSGCGQQHGSVYWRYGSAGVLKDLDPAMELKEQLKDAFSVKMSPVWQDSSTTIECNHIERTIGGPLALSTLTGSAAHERFTASQILKLHLRNPVILQQTQRISLISSFAASIFVQSYAPIDMADGSGMNLLDIRKKDWDERLLNVCGIAKDILGEVVDTCDTIGYIGDYWVKRYGFNKDCKITAFTGDNPDTLTALHPTLSDLIISLGTSDTIFFPTLHPQPSTEGHVMCHPYQSNGYMAMIVFKNGSLTREAVRDRYCEGKWELFDLMVRLGLSEQQQQCEDDGKAKDTEMAFSYLYPEITPKAHGIFKFSDGRHVEEFSKPHTNPLTLLQTQFLSFLYHAIKIGYDITPPDRRIIVTGGASRNRIMLRLLSDVFGARVCIVRDTIATAGLGSAVRARFGCGAFEVLEESVDGMGEVVEVCKGSEEKFAFYRSLLGEYERLEKRVCEMGGF